MKDNTPPLAVRALAALRDDAFCSSCWRRELRLKDPFAIPMPGTWTVIDLYSKALFSRMIERAKKSIETATAEGVDPLYKNPPDIFGMTDVPPIKSIPNVVRPGLYTWQQFGLNINPGTPQEFRLRGVPDLPLEHTDGSFSMVDFKTSVHRGPEDPLFKLYEAQLNIYGWLHGKLGLGEVSRVGLLYLSPNKEPDEALSMSMSFTPHWVPAPLWTPDVMDGLLKKAAELMFSTDPITLNPKCMRKGASKWSTRCLEVAEMVKNLAETVK